MTLQKKLDGMVAASADRIPAPVREIMHHETQGLIDAGLADAAPSVGSQAPALQLVGEGGPFELSKAVADGPVVLTWFRGNW